MWTIEFGLPSGAGGMAAAHEGGRVRTLLRQWSREHDCEIIVTNSIHDYRYWVVVNFIREQDITLFALTWEERTFMPWQLAQKGPTT